MATKIKAGVYVLSWDHLVFTQRCLESIWKYTDPSIPILVIDNGSKEETLNWLRARKNEGKIHLIENGKNIGMAPAHNQAIDFFGDKDFCFISNDIVVGYNWLENLQDGVYADERIGAGSPYISPEVTYDDFCNMEFRNNYKQKYQYKFREDPSAGELQNILDELHGGDFDEFTRFWSETRKDIPPLWEWTTMVLYIKRSTINKIGKFDPQFMPSHWEDMDYMLRMNNSDLFRVTVTSSYVFHFGTITTRGDFKDLDPSLQREREENEKRFDRKWMLMLPIPERRYDRPYADKYPFMAAGPLSPWPVSDPANNRPYDKWWLWEPEKYPEIPQSPR